MTQPWNSLIRICNASGKPIGTGFLVGQQTGITCCHVVKKAVPDVGVGSLVNLDFPFPEAHGQTQARVVFLDPAIDLAGLAFEQPLPVDIQPVPLVDVADCWGHKFRACGFPDKYPNGVYASGRLLSRDANGWLLMEDLKTTGYAVQPGFSGGLLWDESERGVVGMVVAADTSAGVRAAFALPVDLLSRTWPELAVHQVPACPYRGLAAFRESHSAFFFGREGFTERLFDAVHKQPFVAVIGSSGSGKSSVVFAGLVPQLRQRGWLIAEFRPGSSPIDSLAQALLPFLEPQMSETDRLIEVRKQSKAFLQRELELRDILKRVSEKFLDTRMLLIADQFEEVFTLCGDPVEQQRFIDLLL